MIEWVLIGIARLLLPLLQALPLTAVARLGRAGGSLAWLLDRRHRAVALRNLELCFGHQLDADTRRRLARENFRNLGENYACGVRTAFMPWPRLTRHIELAGFDRFGDLLAPQATGSAIAALGHFGNFELFARIRPAFPHLQLATTYRGLRQAAATRMLLRLRARSGCLFFERRQDARALREALRSQRLFLGLLADQHDGRGVRVPFLGHDASTSTAPALLALRYRSPLVTLFCFRIGLARWRLEAGDLIPTRDLAGHARPLADIARDMNASFERAIRRDPANWFWVHRRWKPMPAIAPA